MAFPLILYFFLFWTTVSWQATMKTPLTERRKQYDIDVISLLPHISQKPVKPPVTYSIIPVIEPI